jgi:hypothetical protein
MSGKRMNWSRVSKEQRSQAYGICNIKDENERLENDRASRWLNRVEQQHRPSGKNSASPLAPCGAQAMKRTA